jgi:hypothetical protein
MASTQPGVRRITASCRPVWTLRSFRWNESSRLLGNTSVARRKADDLVPCPTSARAGFPPAISPGTSSWARSENVTPPFLRSDRSGSKG